MQLLKITHSDNTIEELLFSKDKKGDTALFNVVNTLQKRHAVQLCFTLLAEQKKLHYRYLFFNLLSKTQYREDVCERALKLEKLDPESPKLLKYRKTINKYDNDIAAFNLAQDRIKEIEVLLFDNPPGSLSIEVRQLSDADAEKYLL